MRTLFFSLNRRSEVLRRVFPSAASYFVCVHVPDACNPQSYHSHRADVLCICPSPDGRSVFASGVDPKVLQFDLVEPDDPTTWVKGRSLQKHTHDVRALAVLGGDLVSGGQHYWCFINFSLIYFHNFSL